MCSGDIVPVFQEVSRDEEKPVVARLVWIVFVREFPPQHVKSDILPPFEFLEQWYSIENLSVEVPTEHGGKISVIEELIVADEAEGLVFDDI